MKIRALGLGLALLMASAIAAEELETAFQALQAAQAKGDVAQIKKSAVELSTAAQKITNAANSPEGVTEDTWAQRVEYAKTLQLNAEYALAAAATKAPPATALDLLTTLEQLNPKSKYMENEYGLYFHLLATTGQSAKLVPAAEKAVAHFPNNEDALLVLADNAVSHKQSDRALAYAKRVIAAANSKSRPEGMSAADWDQHKTAILSRGNYIAGIVSGEKNDYLDADRALREALPSIKSNDTLLQPALFYLGVANYYLGREMQDGSRLRDALRFSQQAANLKGPFSQQAWTNAALIKQELQRSR